ncbi:MAG: glycerophosphodiester phosphodiesterase family protein [Aristaeellaceae bacterium]
MPVALWLLPVLLPILYIWLIHPRLPRRSLRAFTGVWYAHRGLWSPSRPENSCAAFAAAAEAGYGIELDVRMTADGALVIHHDRSLQRLCGEDVRIEASSLERVRACRLANGEAVPTLAEALSAAKGTPLIVEVKPAGGNAFRLSREVYAQLRAYPGPWCAESFSPLALWWFRLRAPEVLRGQLAFNRIRQSASLPGLMTHLAAASLMQNALSRPDFVAYEADGESPRSLPMGLLRRMGTPVAAWTIRSPEALEACRSRCALAIFEGFLPEDRPSP